MLDQLVYSEPMVGLLRRRLRGPWTVYLIALLVNLALHAVGVYYSFVFNPKSIVPLWEPSQIVQSISVGVITSPFIWAFSLWQPIMLNTIVDNLTTKGLIAQRLPVHHRTRKTISLQEMLVRNLVRRRWALLAAVIAILSTGMFATFIVEGEAASQGNRTSVFYATPALKALYTIYFAPHFYLVALIVLRTLVALWEFNRFFSHPDSISRIALFDADRRGGFGIIGQFSLRLALFALIMGIDITTTTLHPLIAGGDANLVVVLIVSFFYLLLAPLCIVPPVIATHKAMLAYRNNLIQQLSGRANPVLMDLLDLTTRENSVAKRRYERLKRMEATHDFILQNVPIWPITWLSIRNFSLVALLSVIYNMLSMAIVLNESGILQHL